ncbi:MAG: hypothetical protein KAH48_05400, partial [Chlorobi bacterium]|nr:hypothetical protein [Chlorobiota bacterium]
MKTFILSVFALFLWLSADVCSAEIEDDYWVNINFPGAEVKFISNHGPYVLWAATVDSKIYEITYNGLKNSDWERLNLVFEGNITTFNSGYIGTDRGLYRFHSRDSVYEVEYFHGQNIINCYYGVVLTDKNIYFKHDSGWVECSLPDNNKTLKSISIESFDIKRTVGITTSGELYISKDSCGSWKEVAGVPKDQEFSAVAWSDH